MLRFVCDKILSYLLFVLFLVLPVAFSFFPYLFGLKLTWGDFGSYEGLRLVVLGYFFLLFFLVVGTPYVMSSIRGARKLAERKSNISPGNNTKIYTAIRKLEREIAYKSLFQYRNLRGYLLFLGACLTSVLAQYIFVGNLGNWYFGSTEFHLGLFWYASIALLAWIIFSVSRENIRFAVSGAFFSLGCVLVYALVQYFGIDPIGYSTPFESSRVFSTLGNPNMLAAYYLLFIPVVLFRWNNAIGWIFALSLLAMIATTQSWSAFLLGSLVFSFHLFRNSGIPKIISGTGMLLLCISLLELMQLLDFNSKLLGLSTRLEIIESSFKYILQPYVLMFGGGELQYNDYFNTSRSENLLKYIPSTHILGHSHNLFLDFFMRFGILGLSGLFVGIFLSFGTFFMRKKIYSSVSQESWYLILLFLVMASIHHIELPIWAIFLLFLRRSRKC